MSNEISMKVHDSPNHKFVVCDCISTSHDAMFGKDARVSKLYERNEWRCTNCGKIH
jgi:hypothetical protein